MTGMLMRPAGHEAKAEARESEDEAEAQKIFSRPRPRPRPDTLENNVNSVCMSMKTIRYWHLEHSFQ